MPVGARRWAISLVESAQSLKSTPTRPAARSPTRATYRGSTTPWPNRHPLSFGVVIAQHQYTWPELVSQWKLAEELGFDSIWLFDHFMALYADPDGPCLETSTLLAALAKETSRAKIGVLVYGNTHRHPSVLAKEIVTVDHVSDGRAILGIGAGWNEREHRAYGIPFPSAGDRVEMLDESLQIIESLFTQHAPPFTASITTWKTLPSRPSRCRKNCRC